MDPLAALTEIGDVERPADLERGAMLIAALARPDMDVEGELAVLDDIAAAVPTPTLDGLRATLFGEMGFRGNAEDYYDPDNSRLDVVLRSRTGIPISLSVVTIAVGRRCGVPLVGVGMPGHFLVRDEVVPDVFVDPFDGGAVLDRARCEALYTRVVGGSRPFDPAFLEPVSGVEILDRMLANLTAIHLAAGDVEALTAVTAARARLGGRALDVADAAVTALAAVGRWDVAAAVVEDVLAHRGDRAHPAEVDAYRQRVTGLLARLN